MDKLDWKYYINRYSDLRNAGIRNESQAMNHWKKFGKNEGRIPNGSLEIDNNFDWQFYVNLYPDLRQANIVSKEKAHSHWIHYGKNENRLCRKQNIFIYSTCHGEYIRQILTLNDVFNSSYNVKFFPNYFFRLPEVNEIEISENVKNEIIKADIIIYQNVSNKYKNWSTDELFKLSKPECKFIRFPYFYNTAFFPLCTLGDYMGSKIFGIETIIENIKNNKSLDEIKVDYMNNKLNWYYRERFNYNIQRGIIEEKLCDVKYIDFFLQHYEEHRLFLYALYPTEIIYIYASDQIMDLLHIGGKRFDPINDKNLINLNQQYTISTSAAIFFKFKWYNASMCGGDALYLNWIEEYYNKITSKKFSENDLINGSSYSF